MIKKGNLNIVKLKKRWMLQNGFRRVNGKEVYEYKGNYWTLSQIKTTPALLIMKSKDLYDGLISRKQFESIVLKVNETNSILSSQ